MSVNQKWGWLFLVGGGAFLLWMFSQKEEDETPFKTAEVTGSNPARASCIECAIKHSGVAQVFLEEAVTRPQPEARQRVLKAYHHLSHAGDVHLAQKYPELAAKVRKIRKKLEPCLFKGQECPPNIYTELENLQQTLLKTEACPKCSVD